MISRCVRRPPKRLNKKRPPQRSIARGPSGSTRGVGVHVVQLPKEADQPVVIDCAGHVGLLSSDHTVAELLECSLLCLEARSRYVPVQVAAATWVDFTHYDYAVIL